jgi:hypothetical protein
MTGSAQIRRFAPPRGRLVVAAAVVCAALTFHAGRASAQSCSVHYPFGTVQLRESDFFAGRHGADFRLLYGDWDWLTTFGLNIHVAKAEPHVRDVAKLVRDCVGDLRYGRLDFRRRQVVEGTDPARPETDPEYFTRVFDELVATRRELAVIENSYAALLHDHAPNVGTAWLPELRSLVSETVQRTLARAANRSTGLGWVVVHMQDLDDALANFQTAHQFTHELITVHLSQFPEILDLVIDELINNTQPIVDQYGEFFSPEGAAELQALIDAAEAQRGEPVPSVIGELTVIANQIQDGFDDVWTDGTPLQLLASKLKFVFGACATTTPHPITTSVFFGDLPVSARIVERGDDEPFCIP